MPASLVLDTAEDLLISIALVTAAVRRRLLACAFTLQLGGPFTVTVRAGFHLFPLSAAPG
ncbi:MAG TPA: hypothetical protein PK040_02115 [Anaerolineaceae bacterium]|nr:hypothetical protein [Anaerolineaceae bacterium]